MVYSRGKLIEIMLDVNEKLKGKNMQPKHFVLLYRLALETCTVMALKPLIELTLNEKPEDIDGKH